ncbi:hypothetical protein FRB94_006928 [Tulasnella sp. JGI-2019a]|nr:hypothetical protein FRB94_006928 [Tulasnella sp. JGI-2019a]KAG9000480.1 hypothetical protein FRB93_012685 [Tulasnella sp. JGI-2019a]
MIRHPGQSSPPRSQLNVASYQPLRDLAPPIHPPLCHHLQSYKMVHPTHLRRFVSTKSAQITEITAGVVFGVAAIYLFFKFVFTNRPRRTRILSPETPSPYPPRPTSTRSPYRPRMNRVRTTPREELPAYDASGKPPEYDEGMREGSSISGDEGSGRARHDSMESERSVNPPSVPTEFVPTDIAIPPAVLTRLRLEGPRPTFRIPIIGREPDGLRVSVAEAIMTPTELSRANSPHPSPVESNPGSGYELRTIVEVVEGETTRPA